MVARRYIDEVLEPQVVPFVENMGPTCFLQHDNDRLHVARRLQNFFNIHNIEVMDWPTHSPELNPIDHAWDTFVQRLKELQPILNIPTH